MNVVRYYTTLLLGTSNIIAELRQLKQEIRNMADALADLTAAIAGLATEVSGGVAQIQAETAKILELVNNPPITGIDPAAVEAAVASITTISSGLHDAVAAAQGSLNPAPAPAPAV